MDQRDPAEVPEGDALEQRTPADGGPDEAPDPVAAEPGAGGGEAPEADRIEQSIPAAEGRVRIRSEEPPEVDQADWLDQTVIESEPDEEADRRLG